LHEPLARYDRRTADVLAWVRDVGADGDVADGDDLVHLDFHPGNVLVDAGAVSGVVDWDGAARGDGRFDLVTLRFYLAMYAPELTPWFDELLDARVPPRVQRAYWAHMSLRQVDWSIRHHPSAAVDFWLDVSARGRARLGDG
jgi:aminoglycoside phosphotransferase (APT) family kinase protein